MTQDTYRKLFFKRIIDAMTTEQAITYVHSRLRDRSMREHFEYARKDKSLPEIRELCASVLSAVEDIEVNIPPDSDPEFSLGSNVEQPISKPLTVPLQADDLLRLADSKRDSDDDLAVPVIFPKHSPKPFHKRLTPPPLPLSNVVSPAPKVAMRNLPKPPQLPPNMSQTNAPKRSRTLPESSKPAYPPFPKDFSLNASDHKSFDPDSGKYCIIQNIDDESPFKRNK